MSTSKKHTDFVSEPIGNKSVRVLPGIGNVLASRLENVGITSARNLLGQYLVFNKDETKFKNWLSMNCGANRKQANDCYQAIKVFVDNHM